MAHSKVGQVSNWRVGKICKISDMLGTGIRRGISNAKTHLSLSFKEKRNLKVFPQETLDKLGSFSTKCS